MKKFRNYTIVLLAFLTLVWSNQNAFGQNNRTATSGAEEFKGSIISYNGPQVATAFFNLRLNGRTSDEQSRQYLNVLKNRGQSNALEAIRDNDLGSFSIGNNLARTLNVVRESTVDGQRRIFIVFERWTQFAEHRFGTRSLDYPFGVIELYIDPRTGKGEGTYIAAARIRFDDDTKTKQQTVEIENFATYPARLTNVTVSRSGKS
ncbi:MAG TPA: hypothetical protein VF596_15455 [Pyrinomonadaceae bacterium]|jgi:hypothetical protein